MPKGIPGSRPPCSKPNCGKPAVGHGLCRKHYSRWWRHGDPDAEREHHDPLSFIDRTEGCWYWTGPLAEDGYGVAPFGYRNESRVAHRLVYVRLVGLIPDGLTLDHECHNRDGTCPGGKDCFHRSCVRPDHLVPRTKGANSLASHTHPVHRTHCPAGHSYDEANTRIEADGSRACRACARERARKRRQRLEVAKG